MINPPQTNSSNQIIHTLETMCTAAVSRIDLLDTKIPKTPARKDY